MKSVLGLMQVGKRINLKSDPDVGTLITKSYSRYTSRNTERGCGRLGADGMSVSNGMLEIELKRIAYLFPCRHSLGPAAEPSRASTERCGARLWKE